MLTAKLGKHLSEVLGAEDCGNCSFRHRAEISWSPVTALMVRNYKICCLNCRAIGQSDNLLVVETVERLFRVVELEKIGVMELTQFKITLQ